MAEIEVATFEQIATLLSQLSTNYSNLAVNYYDIFYNPVPQDVTIQLYDAAGVLKDYVIPNRAKDFRFVLNGEGTPEGAVSAKVGTTYQDTLNGRLYIKQLGEDTKGWVEVASSDDFIKGEGSPEGAIPSGTGTLYVDTKNGSLYIKTTKGDTSGWVELPKVGEFTNRDLSNLSLKGEQHFADPALSNLNSLGEDHFANPSLSNLSIAGKNIINGKEDVSNKTNIIDASSTNIQYPSAGAVYAAIKDSTGNPDNKTIIANEQKQLQAIGVLEKNKSSVTYDWIGTLAEYEAQQVAVSHPDWLCYITDDISIKPDQRIQVFKPDDVTIKVNSEGIISAIPATTEHLGTVKPDGASIKISPEGAIYASPATKSRLGAVKPDGTSITVDFDGTIHSVGGSGGGGGDFNIENLPGVTNCILSMPENGISVLENGDISVKAGITFLLADGLNPDGSPKSRKATLNQDTTIPIAGIAPSNPKDGIVEIVCMLMLDQDDNVTNFEFGPIEPMFQVYSGSVEPPIGTKKMGWIDKANNVGKMGIHDKWMSFAEAGSPNTYITCPVVTMANRGTIENPVIAYTLSKPIRVARQQELLYVLDYATYIEEKVALTDKKIDEVARGIVKNITPQAGVVEIDLEHNVVLNVSSPVQELTITNHLTSEQERDGIFICQLNFESPTPATTFICHPYYNWFGDDIDAESGEFVPKPEARYVIMFYSDGSNIRALVQKGVG